MTLDIISLIVNKKPIYCSGKNCKNIVKYSDIHNDNEYYFCCGSCRDNAIHSIISKI